MTRRISRSVPVQVETLEDRRVLSGLGPPFQTAIQNAAVYATIHPGPTAVSPSFSPLPSFPTFFAVNTRPGSSGGIDVPAET